MGSYQSAFSNEPDSSLFSFKVGLNPFPAIGVDLDVHENLVFSGSFAFAGLGGGIDSGLNYYFDVEKKQLFVGSKIGVFGLVSSWAYYQSLIMGWKEDQYSIEFGYALGEHESIRFHPEKNKKSRFSSPMFAIYFDL